MMMNITIYAVTLFITQQLRVVRKNGKTGLIKVVGDVVPFLEVDVFPLSTFL